jgi:enoyl-[acyl-carrier protein] reductase/trans-2-enoyl-CoA reductase (NAD+)
MIIEPKIRGFICTTAHPLGCEEHVREDIDYIAHQASLNKFKNVLILGCSTGYGLATRITAAFACNAATLGVMFERPADEKRTASPGWYNTKAFEAMAHRKKLYAKTINADAFSDACKQEVIETLQRDFPKGIDLVIYSLASPRRTDPVTGETFMSTLKPVGHAYSEKTVNVMSGEVTQVNLEPASDDEINNTIKVMGGEDWARWIDQLLAANVLAKHCTTVAYSYIGPQITYPVYRSGTIGKAKEHLESTTKLIQQKLASLQGHAYIAVNKAVVTQASAAIPVVPLYASILYKVMKEKHLHEGCIEQMYRLFSDNLCTENMKNLDQNGFIRLDNLELRTDVQEAVEAIWKQVSSENIAELTDIAGYRKDFYQLFGFNFDKIDYNADIKLL